MHYFREWHSGILSQISGWKTDFMLRKEKHLCKTVPVGSYYCPSNRTGSTTTNNNNKENV